jgi:hypothetical protein
MDSLQFQKIEYADSRPKCALCQGPLESMYFHLAGQRICPACAEKARAAQARPANAAVVRGLLCGAGTAVLCSAGYASIVAITGYELALVAIAVGYLVGRAVRRGSAGLGGRRCQAGAVVLTYLAITLSYLPLIIRGADASAGQVWAAIVPLLGIALAFPFLQLSDGVSGLLGLAIIAFGLLQAWRQTARDPRLLMGPYTLEEGTSPVA